MSMISLRLKTRGGIMPIIRCRSLTEPDVDVSDFSLVKAMCGLPIMGESKDMSEPSGIAEMRKRMVGQKVVYVDQAGDDRGDCAFTIVVENGSTLVVDYSLEEGRTCLDGYEVNIESR